MDLGGSYEFESDMKVFEMDKVCYINGWQLWEIEWGLCIHLVIGRSFSMNIKFILKFRWMKDSCIHTAVSGRIALFLSKIYRISDKLYWISHSLHLLYPLSLSIICLLPALYLWSHYLVHYSRPEVCAAHRLVQLQRQTLSAALVRVHANVYVLFR